jgi:hypothetical protein
LDCLLVHEDLSWFDVSNDTEILGHFGSREKNSLSGGPNQGRFFFLADMSEVYAIRESAQQMLFPVMFLAYN